MKKILPILLFVILLFWILNYTEASEKSLDFKLQNKIDIIVNNFIKNVNIKYSSVDEQIPVYKKLNDKITKLKSSSNWNKLLLLNYLWKLLYDKIIFLESKVEKNKDYKVFKTSFETIDDFKDFYIVPQNYKGTSHNKSDEIVHTGKFSHKGWVYKESEPSTLLENNNHRWYPTIQLYKTPKGSFQCPCYITLWTWVDADLKAKKPQNEWLSFATLTSDETDSWKRPVLINLDYNWFVHLMHVPNQGKSERIFQTNEIKFPMKKWVELKIFLDLDPSKWYAKVWQDGELVSYANVIGMNGKLAQAHFGVYAAPSISKMTIYNDDLTIQEVEKE